MENSSLVKSLIAAKNSLTPETWFKGNYFGSKNNVLCMCAHGAVQAQVNTACKNTVDKTDAYMGMLDFETGEYSAVELGKVANHSVAYSPYPTVSAATAASDEVNLVALIYPQHAPNMNALRDIWNNRVDWVKDNHTGANYNYGNKDAHYLLGMVGLTSSFNDRPNTTLEMVHQKFDEAIELARELNV